MALSQKRKFTFTWHIQSFSMCPRKFKEELKSPVFLVKMLENSKWQLELYPKGSETENDVSFFLRCISVGRSTDVIKIGFNISLFSVDVTKRVRKEENLHAFKKGHGWGFPCLISRDSILDGKDSYLPNNTLTIKCSIWRSDDLSGENDSFASDLKDKDLLADVMKYNQDSARWDECTVVTRIQSHRKNVFWPIGNFSSIDAHERLVTSVPSILGNLPSLYITFNKSIDLRSAEIHIRKGLDSSEDTFVKCKVSVLHTPRGVDIFSEDTHLFESYDEVPWKFPSFIKFHELGKYKHFNRTCDVLHLRFELSFSQLEDVHHTENVFFHKNETLVNLTRPIEEFRHLYEDGELSDVAIRVADKEFNVHKIILKVRSPVFRAMLNNDMKEKETGVIDITDVDPDTMDKMLNFMYTDGLGDMLAEEAIELFAVADKYELLSLKVRSAWILASSLSVSNVCLVLTLADQYNDEYLLNCAEGFIQANSVEIFRSQEWENFMQNSGTLAAKVMLKMLTN